MNVCLRYKFYYKLTTRRLFPREVALNLFQASYNNQNCSEREREGEERNHTIVENWYIIKRRQNKNKNLREPVKYFGTHRETHLHLHLTVCGLKYCHVMIFP